MCAAPPARLADLAVLDETPVPVVAIVPSSGGNLTGRFVEPIRVTLAYDSRACSQGRAAQSADAQGISALVAVDAKQCPGSGKVRHRPSDECGAQRGQGSGLSTGGKVAVGVVCGVIGLLLLLLIGFFAIRALAPETAISYDL